MRLRDINRTAINVSKISLINDSAIDLKNKRLMLTLDDMRYSFCYLEEQDLLEDYNEIYTRIEGM